MTDRFSLYSGLKPNKEKCEGIFLGPDIGKIGNENIKWPLDPFRVIGIKICADYNKMISANEDICFEKVTKEIERWKERQSERVVTERVTRLRSWLRRRNIAGQEEEEEETAPLLPGDRRGTQQKEAAGA